MTTGGAETGEKMATDQRDGLGGALMREDRVLPEARAAVIAGRLGTRHVTSQEGRHCSAGRSWNDDSEIYVLQLFF